jgi:oligosaccharide repeat unit polymerase
LIVGWLINDNYFISITPFLWLNIFLISFIFGFLFIKIPRTIKNNIKAINTSIFKLTAKLVLISSVVFTIVFFAYYNISLKVFFDFDELIKVNDFFSFLRYNNPNYPLSTRIFLQIDSTLLYSSSLFGGVFFSLSHNFIKKLFCLSFLFPAIVKVLIINAKQVIIAAVLLFVVGLIVANIVFPKKYRYNFTKFIPIIILTSFIFVSILISSIFLRNNSFEFEQLFIVFSNYGFGGYYGFDNFFQNYDGTLNFGFGVFNVFYNLFRILIAGSPKEFSETIVLQDSIWRTNIIMMYGQLISDFGIIGSLFFSFVSGLLFSSSLSNIKRNQNIAFSTIIFAMSLFFYFHSPFGSSWNYLSLINPFIILYLALKTTILKGKLMYVQ